MKYTKKVTHHWDSKFVKEAQAHQRLRNEREIDLRCLEKLKQVKVERKYESDLPQDSWMD